MVVCFLSLIFKFEARKKVEKNFLKVKQKLAVFFGVVVRVKKESRINQNRVWNKERVTFFLCQPLVGLPMPGGAPPIELLTVARSRMVSISACMKAHGFWEP